MRFCPLLPVLAEVDGTRHWPMEIRSGPYASREGANSATSARRPPLALCKFGVRGISGVVPAPGQVGYPPAMNTDASLGYPQMDYRSAEVVLGACEADGCVLARLGGTASRGPPGNKRDLTQKTKVGNSPCCAIATNVAFHPPPLVLGKVGDEDARDVALREEFGPRGNRRPAALQDSKDYRFPPVGLD